MTDTAPSTTLTVSLPAGALAVTAAPPEWISQRTSEAVLGVPRRPYLEAVRRYEAGGGEVLRLGRLRLVERVAFLAWLRRQATEASPEHDGVAEVADALGWRLAAEGGS